MAELAKPQLHDFPGHHYALPRPFNAQLATALEGHRTSMPIINVTSPKKSPSGADPLIALGIILIFLPLHSGCAGYQLGNRSLYRADIRTVYVPMFESDSLRRNLGERLTEAVVKEIETKTPFKVLSDPELADSVLTGKLITERKAVLAENRDDEPRDVETNLVVVVTWLDRQGFAMSQASTFSLSQQGFSVAQTADFVPEAGQSVSTAQQEAIQRIAKQIVSQMEAPW